MKSYQSVIDNANLIFGNQKWNVYFSPGRVNLIGEHTDYNGGYVLPCALDIGIMGTIALREDKIVRCYSREFDKDGILSFSLSELTRSQNWADYVKGVIKESRVKLSSGFDLYIESDVPNEVGLSSSAALELLIAQMMNREFQLGFPRLKLVHLAQKAENRFIGVQCGIMDQFAISMGKENKAIFLNTDSLKYEYVKTHFLETALVVANTKKKRALIDSRYNERRNECQTVLKQFKKRLSIENLCDMSVLDFETNKHEINDEVLLRRARHVVYENNRTRIGKAMLENRDLRSFGNLMYDSHESLKNDYEVSCFELDTMVEAFRMQGALGARMTGAGFGGSVVAIMPMVDLEARLSEVRKEYEAKTNLVPDIYVVNTGRGVYKVCHNINSYLNELLAYAVNTKLLKPFDYDYGANLLLDLLGLDHYVKEEVKVRKIDEILEDICQYCYQMGILSADDDETFDRMKAKLMDSLMEDPSAVNETFQTYLETSHLKATKYLYELGLKTNYIQTNRIQKNIHWNYESSYGVFKMTINLSKPEKNPRDIAKLISNAGNDYPKCQLCKENVGYAGNDIKDSRRNLRIVEVGLDHERWYLQYSPYAYFTEHGIIFSEDHHPMVIEKSTFRKLIDFIIQFPTYFVGSNADLPIVGGSILNHEHFQCGKYKMPIEEAREEVVRTIKSVQISRLIWPLSTIRLRSTDELQLIEIADQILNHWKKYQNKALNIHNLPEIHNTITPICRFREGEWIMDLILRNNFTTETAPWGVFHPDETLHHIKRENIGLIEAMGMAILPPRLEVELEKIQQVLEGDEQYLKNYDLRHHRAWIEELKKKTIPNDIPQFLLKEVGNVFQLVLESADVFKFDAKDRPALIAFIHQLEDTIH